MKRLPYIAITLLLAAIVVPVLWSQAFGESKIAVSSLNKGLIAHWSMAQSGLKSSTVMADLTANGNNLTKQGTVTLGGATDAHGQASRATDFAATGSLFSSTAYSFASAKSISLWLKQDTYNANNHFNNIYTNATNYMRLVLEDGNLTVNINGTTYKKSKALTDTASWHHIVVTWDGASTIALYLDNVVATSGVGTGNDPTVGTSIGMTKDVRIADYKIYNRVLSTTEVASLYNTYRPKIAVSSLQKGLVGHWDLAQTSLKSSTTIADKTPNGNTGTLVGSPTFTTDQHGQADRAMSFDGSSQYVDVADSTSNSFTTDMTVTAWIKSNSIASGQSIISRWTNTGNQRSWLFIVNNSKLTFNTSNDGIIDSQTIMGNTTLSSSVWYYAVATFTSSSKNAVLYVNGNNDGSTTFTNSGIYDPNRSLIIGAREISSGSYDLRFNGSIADVRIYNRALSATEVTSLYNSYRPKIAVSSLQKGLVGHWDLAQTSLKSSTTIADKTPNGNTGTLVGSPWFTTDQHGQSNKAMSFDGSSNVISTNTPKPSMPLTISMWVNPASATPVGIFDTAPGVADVLRNYPAGYVEWWNASPSVTLNLSASQWQHLVFIYQHDGTNRILTYYKNGTLQTSASVAASSTFTWNVFKLGNINNGSAGWYNGSIADVRIYNRALSATEVTALYNSY